MTGLIQQTEDVWKQIADNVNGMDRKVFTELMNSLWSATGRTKAPDKNVLRLWYVVLADLTPAQFATAIAEYLQRHSKEYLSVQLIRELSGVQVSDDVSAMGAWEEALCAIRLVGGYGVPEFSQPATSHTISNLGGWVWFCDQKPDVLRDFVRKRFIDTFKSLSTVVKEPTRLRCMTDSGQQKPVKIGFFKPIGIEV